MELSTKDRVHQAFGEHGDLLEPPTPSVGLLTDAEMKLVSGAAPPPDHYGTCPTIANFDG